MIFWMTFGAQAFGAEGYQTNLGPAPLDGSNRASVLGHGAVLARLNGTTFTLHGAFAGLATPATDAHLCQGNVMGGTGPAIYDVTVTPAENGEVSATVTLTPDQVQALNAGKIFLLLDSQKAPKGNLWGWFQPAHKTVGQDIPEHGHWYIPNILQDVPRKNPQS
jgi:CHRD domain